MAEDKYKYVVWVGGVDDYYTTYNRALEDFNEWVEKEYDDVQLLKFKKEKNNASNIFKRR